MSDNKGFLRKSGPGRRAKHPRTTPLMANRYTARFHSVEGLELQNQGQNRHWELVFNRVGARLRADLGCESYLLDAAWRWLRVATRSKESLESYLQHFVRWVRFTGFRSLSSQIDRTTSQVVEDYITHLMGSELEPRTVRTAFAVLRSWVSWYVDHDLANDRAYPIRKRLSKLIKVDAGRVKKGDGMRRSFSLAEAQAVITYANGRPIHERCALALLLATGCRGHEIADAKRNAFTRDDSGAWTWAVRGKGDKIRKVTVEAWAWPILDEWVARRGRGEKYGKFLRKGSGAGYSVRTIQRWAKEAAKAIAQPEMSTHDFRKTHATLLHEAGAPLDEVQRRLGHSDAKLTSTCYTTRHREVSATTGIGATDGD
jgi:integrase